MSHDHSSIRVPTIWHDGRSVAWDTATIHATSHVAHYGSSVFEGIRCYDTPNGPAVFRLADHVARLLDSCRIYRIPIAHDAAALVQGVLDAVTANALRDCYIRPIVMRTGQQLGFNPIGVPVETFIIAVPWGSMLGPQASVEGIDVGVSSWRRPAPDTLPTLAKAGGNYLISQLAKMEAREHGYAEGLLLDATGNVAEGGAENVFLVQNGTVVTPPIGAGILPGITRRTAMQLAGELGFPVREATVPREALYGAHELFLTGTGIEVCPIRAVDGLTVGDGKPGPVTRAIQERYAAAVRGRHASASEWLTYAPHASA